MKPMVFDTWDPTEVPIKIGAQWFCLREADEETAASYRTSVMRGLNLDINALMEGGTDSIANSVKGIDLSKSSGGNAELLSKCFYYAEYDKENEKFISYGGLVPLEKIQRIPQRVSGPIIEALLEISQLDQAVPGSNPQKKAGQSSTTGG